MRIAVNIRLDFDSMLLRRLAWASAEIGQGRYVDFRSRMLADSLPGLEGLLVGVVGFGTIDRVGIEGTGAYTATYASVAFNGFAPLETFHI